MGAGDPGGPGVIGRVRDYLPRGNTLDEETFHGRHLLICWLLGLHVPALFVLGVWQGFGVGGAAVELITPVACLVLARTVQNRRFAAFFATAGLVFCSSVLVHFSGGMIEAHFHFFILIGIIALYQDWVPFAWNAVFTVLSHGLGSGLAADSMFNHHAGRNGPWLWATIHGIAVVAGCVGVVVFWKSTENVQIRNSKLLSDLGASEIAAAQADAHQRRTMSDLLVNLARRNQSLLNRQLSLIAELEQREREPEALAELFQLDHLATRIRRNAESLLVLSGDDPPRLWGRPMPLSEVVRAAAAEVEDYGRVDVLVNDHIEVAGRAVADLAHLLAELIENATTFSPPGTAVRVRSHLAPTSWSSYMVSIEDTGIGMSDPDLVAANAVLAEPHEVDMRRSTLGFHVVSRLANRYGIEVRVAQTPGGGLTALVTLPDELVAERAADGSVPASLTEQPEVRPAPAPVPALVPVPEPVGALPSAPAPLAAPAPAPMPAPLPPPPPPSPLAPPIAPAAASLATPPAVAPSGRPGALTPADVGALAAFTSPAPPAADAGMPGALVPTPSETPAPVAPGEQRPPGTIWPSTLSSSDALPVAAPPSALQPMTARDVPPPVPPAPPAPPTPPLVARGGTVFERARPGQPPAPLRRADSLLGSESLEDTPVPSLTRPFVPAPRVVPADDNDELLPRLGRSAPGGPFTAPPPTEGDEVAPPAEPADAGVEAGPDATETEAADPVGVAEAGPDVPVSRADIHVEATGEVPVVSDVDAREPSDGDAAADAVVDALVAEIESDVTSRAKAGNGATEAPAEVEPGVEDATTEVPENRTPDRADDHTDTDTDTEVEVEVEAPVAATDEGATNGAEKDNGADAPENQPPARTADGLVRRVPGAGLAAALRRDADKTAARAAAEEAAAPRPTDSLDREAVRSMLSQFQASQRAGRAIADSPVDLRPPEEDT